jgi:hypothetical protein
VTAEEKSQNRIPPVSAIAARLQNIDRVWQLHGEFGRLPIIADGDPQPEFAVLGTVGKLAADSKGLVANVDLGFRLTATPEPGQDIPNELVHKETGRVILAYVKASFAITYTLRDGPALTDADVHDFCSVNAIHNAWPFWREFITSALTRSGLHGVPVPPFMIQGAGPPPFVTAHGKPQATTSTK